MSKANRRGQFDSLGDPTKDLRLVELLEKELRLKKTKLEEDTSGNINRAAKEEVTKKLEDFAARCNALGIHYAKLDPPKHHATARQLYMNAEAIVKDTSPFVPFFPSEPVRLKLLATTYQNLGTLEKQADDLKLSMEYHTKAIEIEMQLRDLKDEDTDVPIKPIEDQMQSPTSIQDLSPSKPVQPKATASDGEFNEQEGKRLLQVVRRGQQDAALQLLAKGTCNVNAADSGNNTVLHHACQNRMTLVVRELCKLGAFVNPVNDASNTPLHFTASSSLELTKILLNTGVDMFIVDNTKNSALHYACLANLSDVALLLLDRGADFRTRNNTGNTPLHYAVSSSMSSVVEMIISRGGDINSRDYQDNTPLHYACSLLIPNMAMAIIHHKPDLDIVNKSGNTALLYACSNSMVDIAMLMIRKGADVTKVDSSGNSCLHYACANQLESVAKTLICHRDVKPSISNHSGNTPLHYAASSNNLSIVKMLIATGVDVHCQDKTLNTPLHYACLNETPEVAEHMIAHGASIHVKNSDGKTPLDYAVVAL